mmetsp:Transcript_2038/g.7616  ORF Transcript_2038/g.7616 Transcript_2038/m.7616 type:complete len:93 (-) Transcript_2038:4393-4671(-)
MECEYTALEFQGMFSDATTNTALGVGQITNKTLNISFGKIRVTGNGKMKGNYAVVRNCGIGKKCRYKVQGIVTGRYCFTGRPKVAVRETCTR